MPHKAAGSACADLHTQLPARGHRAAQLDRRADCCGGGGVGGGIGGCIGCGGLHCAGMRYARECQYVQIRCRGVPRGRAGPGACSKANAGER